MLYTNDHESGTNYHEFSKQEINPLLDIILFIYSWIFVFLFVAILVLTKSFLDGLLDHG